jgi:spermidine synthase
MTHPLRYIPPDLCETDATVSDGLRKTFRGTLKYKTPDYAILQNEKLDEIFLYNNNFISNTADIILEKEMLAHGLMSCLSHPKFILALGGIDGSLLREVLKWSCVEKVIIVHQDDEIVNSYFQKKSEGNTLQ